VKGARLTGGYAFREDIAFADAAFRAWGPTREAVFEQAARATLNVMVEELASVRAVLVREVELQGERLDLLLFDFLNEILFYKDAEQLLLLPVDLTIEEREGALRLRAVLTGERIDPAHHRLGVDVKAVTLHRFVLERKEGEWRAEIVLDI